MDGWIHHRIPRKKNSMMIDMIRLDKEMRREGRVKISRLERKAPSFKSSEQNR